MDIGPPKRAALPVLSRGSQRRRLRLVAIALAALLSLGAGARWLHWQFNHIVLDDARVAADMIMLASRVPGWVTEIPPTAGDRLEAGALLIQVDPREQALAVAELDARLEGLATRRAELEARLAQVDRTTASQYAAARAALDSARSALPAAESDRAFAAAELARAQSLIGTGAATRQTLESRAAALEQTRQRVIARAADIRSAEALMAVAQAGREEMQVLARQLESLGPQLREITATRGRAALDLADRSIRMPFPGIVDRIFVDPGEYVLAGQRIMLIHNPDQVRIEANIRETELRHIRIGTRVTVTVDAWPGREFPGVVDRIVESATSEFALLPSANPSGNFTRISQRMPLRVRLDPPPEPGLLRPGMLVRIEVDTRQ